MREIDINTRFRKDLKKVRQYPRFDAKLLQQLLDKLAAGEQLDAKYRDHKLVKQSPNGLNTCRNFHLAPNIVVIYKLTPDVVEVLRIGSHSDLGMTECFTN